MRFAFSEEQEELRRSVRRFLEDKSPTTEVRRLMETTEGYDPLVWKQMANQLGLQALIIPVEFGGLGFGYLDLIVVFEEMGRALLCAPYLSTVALATNALLQSGDREAQANFLPGIASGTTIATVALTEDSGRWDAAGVTLSATRSGNDYVLDGHKMYVLDGHIADLIVVAARVGDDAGAANTSADAGISLFAVAGDAAGLTRTPLPTLDQTRKQARLEFSGVYGRLIGTEGQGWDTLSRMLDLAAVALAAEQVGGAERALEMAVDHARHRVQFGRPIGSFQAVKHLCAEMLLDLETARGAAFYAALAADRGDGGELRVAASVAKSCCSEAYVRVATDSLHVHGGLGFTWDHDAHLYFKRARSSRQLFGDPRHHREQLARHVGL